MASYMIIVSHVIVICNIVCDYIQLKCNHIYYIYNYILCKSW